MAELKLTDIQGNSHKDRIKNEEKKERKSSLDPVIKKEKIVKKKTGPAQRVVSAFIGDDIKDIKSWLINEVLVPGCKNLILDSLSMAFFKTPINRGSTYSSIFNRQNTPYNRYGYSSHNYGNGSPKYNQYTTQNQHPKPAGRVDFMNIVVNDINDAEEIIYRLHNQIRENGTASIGDLYTLVNEDVQYTDFDWGWNNTASINMRRVSNGYLIDLDRPIRIN